MRKLLLTLLAALPAAAAAGEPAEFKALVPPASAQAALAAFGIQAAPETREIWFFDDVSLSNNARGLLLRLRVPSGGGKADSTVKLRPAPVSLPAWLEEEKGFKCETDRNIEGAVRSCSLTVKRKAEEAAAALSGSPAKAFSREQELLAGGTDYGPLKALGPVKSSEWETRDARLGKISFELWEARGLRFFEISFKSASGPEELEGEIGYFLGLLRARGLPLAPKQSNKTALVLKALAGR